MNINELIQSAIESHQAGNFQKAEQLYKEILQVQPDDFYALHYLGVLFYQLGKYDPAIEYITKALQVNPADANAYYNLGNIYKDKGQLDDAITSYKKALQLNPANADAYVNLGIIFKGKGQFDEAISCYQQALQLNPNLVAAHYNYGYILQAQEQFNEAIIYYQNALKLEPNIIAAYYNLGYIHQAKGQLDEAIVYFEKALQLNPNFADAYNGLGAVFQEKGQLDEAIGYFEKALQLNPSLIDSYNNLGIIYQEKGQYDEAITCYKKVLHINPNQAEIYTNLGNALHSQGKQDEAIAAYDRALECNPNYFMARWARCLSQLPIIYDNDSSIQTTRKRYYDDLIYLCNTISLETSQDIYEVANAVGRQQPFFLAYQGLNNRELQKLYGELVCRIMAARYPQFVERPKMPLCLPGKPLRIGVVSRYFYRHSNWKVPIKGWVENLDKERFRLYGYYTGKTKDQETAAARQAFSCFVEDIYSFEELCQIIRGDNLQVLIYPEIGMDPMSVRLAALRLAPIQCTSWGHPDTSGLPTIDYFLSSDLMEPPDADGHYTEKLVRLPNLSIYYTPLELSKFDANRNTFGLRQTSILYLCCQSLYKYLPQYDEIYPRIAQRAGDCQFIFISHKSNWITEQFRLRLKKAFNRHNLNADDYIMILPRLDQENYYAINRLADIYLDSIDWSGCNTTLEAVACNLPVVTLPNRLLRGRHSFGILTMMGVADTIASTFDNYVELAVKLVQDPDWRRQISGKIATNKHFIYQDKICITALEDFFERVIKEKYAGQTVTFNVGSNLEGTNPLVSVVIPCYNHALFLPEVIESVVDQNYQNWECIIVNDGSTDYTSEIVRQLAAKYSDYAIHLIEKDNSGPSSARNSGIAAAHGKYILPLDADDLITPTMLESCVSLLESSPDIAIAYTAVRQFGAYPGIAPLMEYDFRVLCKTNFLTTTALFRRAAFDAVGGYNSNMIWGYEDWDFWISCGEKGFYGKRILEPLFLRRIKEDSRTITALQHDKEMKAQIILNHPHLYTQAQITWAKGVIAKDRNVLTLNDRPRIISEFTVPLPSALLLFKNNTSQR